MSTEPLRLALWLSCAGLQWAEELPDLATDALVRGLDTPSLRELAGAPRHELVDNRALFRAVVDELGWEVPDEPAALRELVRHWAQEIAAGRLAPYEGAHRIGGWAWRDLGGPDDLTGFWLLADDWEERPEARSRIERDIVAEATALLEDG